MIRRDSENEKLSRIERELLKAGKIADEEIESIVGAPRLYLSIREKIAAEKSRREPAAEKASIFSGFRFWNRRAAAAAWAVPAFLILGAAAFFMRVAPPPETAHGTIAEKQPARVSGANPSDPVLLQNTEPPKKEFSPREVMRVKKAKAKIGVPTPVRAARRLKPSPARFEREPEAPFIALTFAGDFEADEERRIVRVELPPRQLLALGVAVQTENESEKIKTDLLVGADGVARAIRVVK